MSRFKTLLPDLLAAAIRFPAPALLSIALAILINYQIATCSQTDYSLEFRLFDWSSIAAIAFFISGAVHVFCEARAVSRFATVLAGLAAAAITGSIAHYFYVFQSKWDFLVYGSLLALLLAPHLRRGTSQAAFWMYNMRLFLVALFGFTSGFAVALALSAIYYAVKYLLLDGVDYPQMSSHIWWTSAVFVSPFIALGLMPKDFDEPLDISEHRKTILERGMRIIVSFVLVPLVLVFAGVLHVFAARLIIGSGTVHNVQLNEVGVIVSAFVIGAAAVWLIAWPWRHAGNMIVRFYERYWFAVLIVPLGLLAYVLWGRISEAGITANRYGLVIVAAWITFLIAIAAWRLAETDMRLVLAPLAATLLLGGFGPWGAVGVTGASQYSRLENVLSANGVLKEGKLVAPLPKLDVAANDKAHEALIELIAARGINRFKPWFDDAQIATWNDQLNPQNMRLGGYWLRNNKTVIEIRNKLAIAAAATERSYLSYYRNEPVNIDIEGLTRLAGPFSIGTSYNTCCEAQDMKVSFDKKTLTLIVQGKTETLPASDIIAALKKFGSQDGSSGKEENVILTMSGGTKLFFLNMYSTIDGDPELDSATFWALWKP